jgi:OOP family OmpA-OmpF porin
MVRGMTGLALIIAAVLQTPPPPAVPRIYEPVLYYASGSATPAALNTPNLEGIHRFARRPDITAVIIKAHTDTVGSAEDNVALSQRRARWVADRLIADGVSASIIRIEARGESQLARPTADEVDEPLNRRVWVDFNRGPPVR